MKTPSSLKGVEVQQLNESIAQKTQEIVATGTDLMLTDTEMIDNPANRHFATQISSKMLAEVESERSRINPTQKDAERMKKIKGGLQEALSAQNDNTNRLHQLAQFQRINSQEGKPISPEKRGYCMGITLRALATEGLNENTTLMLMSVITGKTTDEIVRIVTNQNNPENRKFVSEKIIPGLRGIMKTIGMYYLRIEQHRLEQYRAEQGQDPNKKTKIPEGTFIPANYSLNLPTAMRKVERRIPGCTFDVYGNLYNQDNPLGDIEEIQSIEENMIADIDGLLETLKQELEQKEGRKVVKGRVEKTIGEL